MQVSARAERGTGWWVLSVPEVEGVFTQVRRLDQAPAMVADAVATMLDLKPEDVELIELTVDLGDDSLDEQVAATRQAVEQATEAQAAASAAMRATVAALRAGPGGGLSVRDTADVLGISFQRVSQLAKG